MIIREIAIKYKKEFKEALVLQKSKMNTTQKQNQLIT